MMSFRRVLRERHRNPSHLQFTPRPSSAYQIAADILYEEPINVRTVACTGCGEWLGIQGQTITNPLTCPKCGAKTALPPYLRARYLPRTAPMPPSPIPMAYASSDLPDFLDDSEGPVPRWLIALTAVLMAIGLIVAVALLAK